MTKLHVLYLICCFFAPALFATEEMVVVQNVSSSGKSFAIRRGLQDGIQIGQTALFSNNQMSISAKVVEATRHYSVWQLEQQELSLGLKKGELLIYNNAVDMISSNIANLRAKTLENFMDEEKAQNTQRRFWMVRGNASLAISESTSEVPLDTNPLRQGLQFEFLFNHLFHSRLEYNVGLRYDREIIQVEDPALSIPTQRFMGVADLNYMFTDYFPQEGNYYMGLGLGFGSSRTETDDVKSAGYALLLPSVRLGYLVEMGLQYVFEGGLESLIVQERFETGSPQRTHVLNSKISVGVKF